MKSHGLVPCLLVGLLVACSGNGNDDEPFDPGPGVLTLDAYPSLTKDMMVAITGSKASGAGILVDGDLAVVQDTASTFSVTLSLTEGPNRFKLEPVAASLRMGDAITIDINLDSIAPGLREVVPADNATNVGVTTTVRATFSETLDCANIPADTMSLAVTNGASIAGAMTCDDRLLVFTPGASLAGMTEHSVTIDSDVVDAAGNVQNIPAAWGFTTAP